MTTDHVRTWLNAQPLRNLRGGLPTGHVQELDLAPATLPLHLRHVGALATLTVLPSEPLGSDDPSNRWSLPHERTCSSFHDDQPFGPQLGKRVPNRRPRDAVLLHQLPFRWQSHARGVVPFADLRSE